MPMEEYKPLQSIAVLQFFLVFILTGCKLPVTKKVSFKNNIQRHFPDSSLSHFGI